MPIALIHRQSRLAVLRAAIDVNAPGALELYALPMVDTPSAAPLAVVWLPAPCGVVDTPGTFARLTISPVTGNATSSGTVGWGRYVDGNGAAVYSALAGLPGSGKPIEVTDGLSTPSANVFAGGEVQVLSAVFLE